jgi:hypothetical protein
MSEWWAMRWRALRWYLMLTFMEHRWKAAPTADREP